MRSSRFMVVLCLGLLTAGCTPDIAELKKQVDDIKQTAPPELDAIPPMKDPEKYVYLSNGLRDPFVSGDQVTGLNVTERASCEGPNQPDMNRAKELLEAFPLDSLDMVGTLVQSAETFGLIKDPDGVVHRVIEGNFLGQNYGRILSIADDRIEIDERIDDGNGCWEAKSAEIALEDSVQ